MQNKRLYRSRVDRMFGGVCGGLGEFTGIDPTLIRLAFVLLALLGGHGLLVYLIMLIVVPEDPSQSYPPSVYTTPGAPSNTPSSTPQNPDQNL